MIEKELELLTIEELPINHGFALPPEPGEKEGTFDQTVKFAFCPPVFRKGISRYSLYSVGTTRQAHKDTLPTKTVTVLGTEVPLTIGALINSNFHYYGTNTITEIEKDYPKVAKFVLSHYNKGYIEEYNAALEMKRDNYKAKIQKQYDELLTVFTELELKSEIATMKDLDELLYCEAAGFMDKLEERINKKNNAKNLRIYKALAALREQDIITCDEG